MQGVTDLSDLSDGKGYFRPNMDDPVEKRDTSNICQAGRKPEEIP